MDFEKWVVDVAVNGVKNGSFTKDWAAMQLANHYSRGKITGVALQRFDEKMNEFEAEMKAEQEEISNELIEITDAE